MSTIRRNGHRILDKFIRAFAPVVLACLLSCGREEPVEGEIVIRAGDLHASIEARTGESSVPVSTAVPMRADSAEVPAPPEEEAITVDTVDTVEESPSDTLPECPWERVAMEVRGSIYGSLSRLIDDPDIIGAHVVRCMLWDVDPWKGVNAGDSIYLLLGETGRENRVVALRYVPVKGSANEPFSLYSFRMTGDNFPSYYYPDGTEVMKLLNTMPVGTFEEMTSPFGEPRSGHMHAGVDFKAPRGTPIRTCMGGRVSRVDWNTRYNGHCVEVDVGSGYREIFLHMESVADGVFVGAVLKKGDVVGTVGNTGVTSTAPHVHYQVNDERGNPIDPYLFLGSHRRHLPPGDVSAFEAFRDSCDAWLAPENDD